MSFSITEVDVWPRLRGDVDEELDRRTLGLRTVLPAELQRQQGWCEALSWVLEQAKPRPKQNRED